MSLFTADDLMHASAGTMTVPFHADGVSIDTRTLQPGDLFVALQTDSGDGHAHVADAMAKGAAGAMVHRPHDLPEDANLLVVGDTLAGLTTLGGFGRTRFTGAVVAVTGSVGKTTTKEMLRLVLAASGRTQASVASYNNHWGVPLTLARLPPDDDYAVVEIGMNHPGEIAPLAVLAGPDVAVVTAIEATHIGHLGSLEAIADEKASVAKGVLQGGRVVLPADTPWAQRLAAGACGRRVVWFGAADTGQVSEEDTGSTFVFDGLPVRVGAPGRHMVMNACAALTAARELGVDLRAGAAALATFRPSDGRGARRAIMGGRAALLDESYNASGASVRAALAVLKLIPAQRRVAVLGDMLELGEFSRAEHESLAGAVAGSADALYTCGPWMKFLYDATEESRRGAHAADSTALARIVREDVRAGDAVLVKGSLGSRMRVVVDALGGG